MKSLKRLFPLLLLLCLYPTLMMAHGVSDADQETLANGGLLAYILVGAKHMVTGYDHLLFLAGVIFYLKDFKDIVRFITVFTLGHSITLTGATYLGIQADEHLIDAVIALSVLYKGFENLGGFDKWFGIKSPNLLLMVSLPRMINLMGFIFPSKYILTEMESFAFNPSRSIFLI